MQGVLRSIHASPDGGLSKPAVERARVVADYGIEGDACARHKRTPKSALCLYSVELYETLQEEGYRLRYGDFAENLLFEGVPFGDVRAGDLFRIGDDVLIEISEVRTPCKTLTSLDARLPDGLVGRSGFLAYARQGGIVQVNDPIVLVSRADVDDA